MLKITKHIKEKMRKFFMRKARINAKIKSSCPNFRIVVNKSNKYIRAQVLDQKGHVVCHICDKTISGGKTKSEKAYFAGEQLAELMKKQQITTAAFDRNGYLYHGRVKALVEGIRKGGINL